MSPTDPLSEDDPVRRIFDEAVQKAGPERTRYVSLACGDDHELRKEVESLIRALEYADQALESLPVVIDNPGSESLTGKSVSHFEIGERLGGGGMGVVYRAHDRRLNREVALKFLPSFLAPFPQWRKNFIEEARNVSSLDHPNIAVVHEIDKTEDGRLFIAMAFYDGETLKKKLARGPLPPRKAVEYALQIANGLAHAHSRGIVHRDIKPANIMITTAGEARIVDFGLSNVTNSVVGRHGPTIGTVAYMSPEQSRGLPTDERTDIWSLGVVLFEMMTGRKPFGGSSARAIIEAIRTEPVDTRDIDRTALGRQIRAVVVRALEKLPEQRFQSVEAFADELRRAALEYPATLTRLASIAVYLRRSVLEWLGLRVSLLLMVLTKIQPMVDT